MEIDNEQAKINKFLSFAAPIVISTLNNFFKSAGFEVSRQGSGLDTAFSIKAGKKETRFFLHNLLLEIATIDRDQSPLRFDEKLRDFNYFTAKTTGLIQSKLNILLQMLTEDNVDVAVERVMKEARHYERIRVVRFDKPESSQDD